MSQDEAVAIALEQPLGFKPECYQVRLYRSGVQSIPVWAVSLWSLDKAGQFERIAVVQVNAETGRVLKVDQNARSPGTQPQCASPV